MHRERKTRAYETDRPLVAARTAAFRPAGGACRRILRAPGRGQRRRGIRRRCGPPSGRSRCPAGENLLVGTDSGAPSGDFGLCAVGLRGRGALLDLLHQARAAESRGESRPEAGLPRADRVRLAQGRRCLRGMEAAAPAQRQAGRVQGSLLDREHGLRAPEVRADRIPARTAPADGLRGCLRPLGHGARHGRHALRRILPARRVRRAQLRLGRVQRRGHQYEGQEYLEGPLRAAGCPALPGAAPFGLLLPGRIRRLLPAARPLRSGRLLRPRPGRPARRVDRRRDGTSGRRRTPGGRPPGEQRLVCAGRLARHADADARRALRHFPRRPPARPTTRPASFGSR